MPSNTPKSKKSWIAFLSTYPPRECGIATFTRDLVEACDDLFLPHEETKIIAMQEDAMTGRRYSKKVIGTITHSVQAEYRQAARKLNSLAQVKLVCIEHEFGIFGGSYGVFLLDFLDQLTKPVCITLHTVLPAPNDEMKAVVQKLGNRVDMITVMTRLSKEILVAEYSLDESKIRIIPHGIHPAAYSEGQKEKKRLKLSKRVVLSTFGLLSSGKGIEYALDALAMVVKEHPEVMYLIIGATHPNVQRHEGEKYREFLTEKITALGLQSHVSFYNKYLSTDELLEFLSATDIYLSLSLNPDQAVSGTLSYALGAGRTVISTAFAQAKEDVTNEVGFLVGFKDPKDISQKLLHFLNNKKEITNKGKNAYFRTRRMTWQNVALASMKAYVSIVPELNRADLALPPIKLSHLAHLTDSFGIFQFAALSDPDPAYGYTLDDNARALMAMAIYHEKHGGTQAAKLLGIYLKAVQYMSKPGEKGFHNYVNFDKTLSVERNKIENLEDANARCYFALCVVQASASLSQSVRDHTQKLLAENFSFENRAASPRALAYYLKGFAELLKSDPANSILKERIKIYANFLVDRFNDVKGADWAWFEDILSYSNGVLPEAMFVAYQVTGEQVYYDIAKQTLDFLIGFSFRGNVCIPIGQSGWYRKSGERHFYDQQPEEVTALVSALKVAYNTTSDEKYQEKLYQAFSWYLGNNLLGQIVYDQATGGCYDGLGEKEINLNQGAESTVVYLLARLNF
jgi:glycosyltransferase involved in cell wall biosynthesis